MSPAREIQITTALLLLVGCAPDPVAPRKITANQEPVALLTVPDAVQAQVGAVLSGGRSLDLDGTIASATLSFGDGTPDAVLPVDLVVEHTWASPGVYDVALAVTDDKGLVGRARTRVTVAPAPDTGAPALAALTLSVDGAPLVDGARVAPGTVVDVAVAATDAEGNLAHVDVSLDGAVAATVELAGAAASGNGAVTLGGGSGDVVVSAVAVDLFGNASASLSTTLHVLSPDDDGDGDGIPDLSDPAPDVFNGLHADVFALADDIPTDLFGNQRAEQLVDDLASSAPVASFTAPAGYLAQDPSTTSLADVYDGAPDTSTLFAIEYTGFVDVPAGADAVVVDVAADDVGVVFLDGVPVASADSEYATDFFRLDKLPPTSVPVAVSGRVPVEIVVANGTDAYAWSVRFTFTSAGTSVMNPEAVTQRQFEVQ